MTNIIWVVCSIFLHLVIFLEKMYWCYLNQGFCPIDNAEVWSMVWYSWRIVQVVVLIICHKMPRNKPWKPIYISLFRKYIHKVFSGCFFQKLAYFTSVLLMTWNIFTMHDFLAHALRVMQAVLGKEFVICMYFILTQVPLLRSRQIHGKIHGASCSPADLTILRCSCQRELLGYGAGWWMYRFLNGCKFWRSCLTLENQLDF